MGFDAQRREQLLDRLANKIAAAGMTAPAILFLEMSKPLAFLGAQVVWVAQPFVTLVLKPADVREFALLLQDDEGVEALIARLEARAKTPPTH